MIESLDLVAFAVAIGRLFFRFPMVIYRELNPRMILTADLAPSLRIDQIGALLTSPLLADIFLSLTVNTFHRFLLYAQSSKSEEHHELSPPKFGRLHQLPSQL